ncbi:ATP-binding cassette domain-containing protein [Nocardioides sp. LHD-245]|uniref:ATP-binding cassette domain-containing protein n=1 Tax=Nocardioides sp. LHD-245 TaxID=3051387 RepID=UPI0027E02E39|nr:ATP-binding cassette domain-containing protein [Nocardioides sp. LHD-245]
MSEPEPLLRAVDLVKDFGGRGGGTRAVDAVSLELAAGETLGVVGESGSGKSTLARLLIRLIEPTSGQIHYRGEDVLAWSPGELRRRRSSWQMVFQNPFGSLLPHLSVADNVTEPLRITRQGDRRIRRARAEELLETVGLARRHADLYPHAMSGGQQQRVAIARALALSPELLVCDEPTSALDVSIQAQILSLLMGLQEELGFAMLFITHNLAVVERLAARVMVMERGRVVEAGPTDQVFGAPSHPYTRTLLGSVLPLRPVGTRGTETTNAPSERTPLVD